MGAKIREQIRPLLEANETVVLDFSNVNVVSNSFADECVAKLLLDYTLPELKKLITFKSLNEMAERSILVALQRRMKMQG
ncbi:MAG: STAS-like domain-containing protein [Bacteroidales bacterium]|nr:STAS-like domain-containing protein [Candidatus Scybalocola fimicaballi]